MRKEEKMSIDVSRLFEPLKVKNKVFRNRIVMPPMVAMRGIVTSEGLDWYGSHARGGVGLVIVEATAVNRFGSDLTVETLNPLVQAIHDGGALAAIQLFPTVIGSSETPASLDRAQIEEMLAFYRAAAEICAAAGFDGVEPHGAHGYLLNQFFSPTQNQRDDEFGRSIENRMRLALRIVETVRPLCGPDMLVLYRHTPVGKGYGIPESLSLASKLVDAGVDILDISPASGEQPADRAQPFKRFGAPVIGVNDMDRVDRAIEALREDRADLIAVGRGLIADPEWPNKVKDGRLDQIVTCTKCDEKCFGNLRKGIPIACTQWV